MTKKIELSTLTLVQLARVYNELSENKITKFADRAAATKRTEKKMTAEGDASGSWVLIDTDVTIDTGIKVRIDDSIWMVVQRDLDVVLAAEAAAAAAPRTPKKRVTKGTFGELEVIEHNCKVTATEAEDGTVTHTVHNPKRGKAAARLQLIIDAGEMTVGQYLDACVALEGDAAEARHIYLRDIHWDIERGFITFPHGAETDEERAARLAAEQK